MDEAVVAVIVVPAHEVVVHIGLRHRSRGVVACGCDPPVAQVRADGVAKLVIFGRLPYDGVRGGVVGGRRGEGLAAHPVGLPDDPSVVVVAVFDGGAVGTGLAIQQPGLGLVVGVAVFKVGARLLDKPSELVVFIGGRALAVGPAGQLAEAVVGVGHLAQVRVGGPGLASTAVKLRPDGCPRPFDHGAVVLDVVAVAYAGAQCVHALHQASVGVDSADVRSAAGVRGGCPQAVVGVTGGLAACIAAAHEPPGLVVFRAVEQGAVFGEIGIGDVPHASAVVIFGVGEQDGAAVTAARDGAYRPPVAIHKGGDGCLARPLHALIPYGFLGCVGLPLAPSCGAGGLAYGVLFLEQGAETVVGTGGRVAEGVGPARHHARLVVHLIGGPVAQGIHGGGLEPPPRIVLRGVLPGSRGSVCGHDVTRDVAVGVVLVFLLEAIGVAEAVGLASQQAGLRIIRVTGGDGGVLTVSRTLHPRHDDTPEHPVHGVVVIEAVGADRALAAAHGDPRGVAEAVERPLGRDVRKRRARVVLIGGCPLPGGLAGVDPS